MTNKSLTRVRVLSDRLLSLVEVASKDMNRNEVMQSLLDAAQKISWRIRKRKWRSGYHDSPLWIVPSDVLLEARKSQRAVRRAVRLKQKIEQLESRN